MPRLDDLHATSPAVRRRPAEAWAAGRRHLERTTTASRLTGSIVVRANDTHDRPSLRLRKDLAMMFLELFVPRGAFSAEELPGLAERLTMRQLLTHVDSLGDVVDTSEQAVTNPGVMDFVDSISHVVVHEVGTWIAGGRPLDPAGSPRYVARVCVPGPWRKAMSAFLIASITRALAQVGPRPDRFYREPRVEVPVVSVPEGGYGIFGRVIGESALLDMISEAKTDTPVPGDLDAFIDPVCGMVASDTVATLEHDGQTYGFCSPGCRRHFAGKLAGQTSR